MRSLNSRIPLVRFPLPLVFAAGLLTLIIGGSTFFASRQTSKESPVSRTEDMPAVPVKTVTATQERLPLQITAAGTAEAFSYASVASDVDGQLTALHFTEGQYVKQGEPLFTIDTRFSQADLEGVRADQSEAADQQRMAEADLTRDGAQASAAEVKAEQYDALYKDGAVSKGEDDRMRAIADQLESLVKTDQDAIASAQESVSAAGRGVHSSELHGGYNSIRSPIDGLATNLVVKRGDTAFAKDATPLVTIEQVNPIYVSFAVPESQLPEINACMSQGELHVAATIGNVAGQTEEGTLGPIAFATIKEDGTASLKASFDNKDRRIQPGKPVTIVLTLMTSPEATVIPSSAVQTDEQGQYVYVVKADQTVESRPVVVAQTVGDKIVIASGLDAGERVVTESQLPLQSGSRVNATRNDE